MHIEQTIEIQANRRLELDLPIDLPLGRAKIAMTIIPENRELSAKGETAFGCLHSFANPSKIPQEKGAWERAVVKNYAES